jgi:hypothetical protein
MSRRKLVSVELTKICRDLNHIRLQILDWNGNCLSQRPVESIERAIKPGEGVKIGSDKRENRVLYCFFLQGC